jgi:hypothetical protein
MDYEFDEDVLLLFDYDEEITKEEFSGIFYANDCVMISWGQDYTLGDTSDVINSGHFLSLYLGEDFETETEMIRFVEQVERWAKDKEMSDE